MNLKILCATQAAKHYIHENYAPYTTVYLAWLLITVIILDILYSLQIHCNEKRGWSHFFHYEKSYTGVF